MGTAQGVENFLNLVWAALAIAMVCAWLREENGNDRRRQFIAILVLIAILLPAISISDDLMAVQKATETDTCVRRSQLLTSGAHPMAAPASKTLVNSVFQGIAIARLGYAWLPDSTVPRFDLPALNEIQSRPPPAA